jgi:hypothetical protein
MSAKREREKRQFIKNINKATEAKTFQILDDYFDSVAGFPLRVRLKMAFKILFKQTKKRQA